MQFQHSTFQRFVTQYDAFCARCSGTDCGNDGSQYGTITYTNAGSVQANSEDQGDLVDTSLYIQTDAKDQCSSLYPDVCQACASSNSPNGQSSNGKPQNWHGGNLVGGSCFACPPGQVYTADQQASVYNGDGTNNGVEEGCHAPAGPPPPPPPPRCDKCDAEMATCFKNAHDAGGAAGDGAPPACFDGCQDWLDCLQDKCGAAYAAEAFSTFFKSKVCSDPAKFNSWGLVFGIGGVVLLGGAVGFIFVKK